MLFEKEQKKRPGLAHFLLAYDEWIEKSKHHFRNNQTVIFVIEIKLVQIGLPI